MLLYIVQWQNVPSWCLILLSFISEFLINLFRIQQRICATVHKHDDPVDASGLRRDEKCDHRSDFFRIHLLFVPYFVGIGRAFKAAAVSFDPVAVIGVFTFPEPRH